MHPRNNCDLCGSYSLQTIIINSKDYESNIHQYADILKCTNCGLLQQNQIFNNAELEYFYTGEYHGRNYSCQTLASRLSQFLRKRYYRRFINIIKNITGNNDVKILDYGSGDGFLLKLLHNSGYQNLYSCDFFPPSQISTKHVTHFHPNNIDMYIDKFDIVLMINSIEHLSSFRTEIHRIIKSMKIKSTIIIETPNVDSLDFVIFQKYWGGLHQPRHTFLWSKSSLSHHLELLGFTSHHLGSPQSAHWAISVQNILSAKLPIFRKHIKNGRVRGYVILVIMSLPLGIVQNLFRQESVMNVIATKKITKNANK